MRSAKWSKICWMKWCLAESESVSCMLFARPTGVKHACGDGLTRAD